MRTQFALFVGLSIVSGFMPSPAIGQESSNPVCLTGRMDQHGSLGAEAAFRNKISEILLAGTPLELGERWSNQPTESLVIFDVDRAGHFTNWKLQALSGSVARDFWTMYAVASCPPIVPDKSINTALQLSVSNAKLPGVRTVDAEQERLRLANSINRIQNAKQVFFPLIPYSSRFCLKEGEIPYDISQKENLVGVDSDRLWKSTANASGEAAELILKTDKQLSSFLSEWDEFYKQNPKTTTEAIAKFAESLKKKYSGFLKEGEPVAPLP